MQKFKKEMQSLKIACSKLHVKLVSINHNEASQECFVAHLKYRVILRAVENF